MNNMINEKMFCFQCEQTAGGKGCAFKSRRQVARDAPLMREFAERKIQPQICRTI